jgi:hypothetical protein
MFSRPIHWRHHSTGRRHATVGAAVGGAAIAALVFGLLVGLPPGWRAAAAGLATAREAAT